MTLTHKLENIFHLLSTAVSFMECARSCVIWTQLTIPAAFLTTLLTSYFQPFSQRVLGWEPPNLLLSYYQVYIFLKCLPMHPLLDKIFIYYSLVFMSSHEKSFHNTFFIAPLALHQKRCGMLSKCSDGITLQKCTLFAIFATLF